jgi:probable O-glycosylation ligase (exosortase A-associated)
MRDLLLMMVLGGGALYALYRPWVGAMLWTWISLMSPHVSFGYTTADHPFGVLVALTTLTGLLFTRDKRNPFQGAATALLVVFVVYTTITLPFSVRFEPSYLLWLRSIKIFLMLFVTMALIDTRPKLNVFIAVCVFSVGFYGFKGGLFTIANGGSYKVWGPGGFIEGNNELSVALLMTVPLIRYLQMQMTHVWGQRFMTLWMLLCMVAIIGSYSRGALVGAAAMLLFFWAKGDRKIQWGFWLVGGVMFLLPLMPDAWWDRMATIQTYDEDSSAAGRIDAWTMAFNLANDRFPFGGGFMVSAQELFDKYTPLAAQSRAAHSIFFQILGEHGWLGLTLFLGIGGSSWRAAVKLIKLSKSAPELKWAGDLGRMVQVSLIGFAVGGGFLSLAYFDMPYNLVAMISVAAALCIRQLENKLPAAAPPGLLALGRSVHSG